MMERKAMDCADVKTLMSGLLDDTLEPDVRHAAERHIAECEPCRTLVNEAERIDLLLARESTVWGDEQLSPEFEANVLARTVLADPRRRAVSRRNRPFRWLAAAAALMLIAGGAVTVLFNSGYFRPSNPEGNEFAIDSSDPSSFDASSHALVQTAHRTTVGRRSWTLEPETTFEAESPTSNRLTAARDKPTVYDNNRRAETELRESAIDPSVTLAKTIRHAQRHEPDNEAGMPSIENSARAQQGDKTNVNEHDETAQQTLHAPSHKTAQPSEDTAAMADESARVPESMRREHAEAVDSASWLIERLGQARTDMFVDVERVRETIEYDNVLDRLAEARRHVAPADRPALLAAESLLLRIVNGPVGLTDVHEIRSTVNEHNLADQLQAISQRWYKAHPF